MLVEILTSFFKYKKLKKIIPEYINEIKQDLIRYLVEEGSSEKDEDHSFFIFLCLIGLDWNLKYNKKM